MYELSWKEVRWYKIKLLLLVERSFSAKMYSSWQVNLQLQPHSKKKKECERVCVHASRMSNVQGVTKTCGCGLVGFLKGITCCYQPVQQTCEWLMWHVSFPTAKIRHTDRRTDTQAHTNAQPLTPCTASVNHWPQEFQSNTAEEICRQTCRHKHTLRCLN